VELKRDNSSRSREFAASVSRDAARFRVKRPTGVVGPKSFSVWEDLNDSLLEDACEEFFGERGLFRE
jgi:hypothetical protein